jgi:DNA helicase-2/ATP-dependent DNA helicase PcrA
MDLLEGLNPQQRLAVTAPPGPVLVLAGPGSGKTRVLTHRIAYLIAHLGARPGQIVAVTFTNKAAREMRTRVETLVGAGQAASTPASGMSLGTFHAFTARLLRREADRLPVTRDFVIFDEDDQHSLIRQALKEFNLDPKQIHPAQIHAMISRAKNELIEAADMAGGSYLAEVARRTYYRYQELLLANNALDFDDLLLWAVRLLRDHADLREAYRRRYIHILVDEFQDTNSVQYALLRLLTAESPDLYAVGDADQSIYRWRGADVRNVKRFEEDYPQARVILLEQNYRSTQAILDVAMGVIDRQPGRTRKRLFTDRAAGVPIRLHEAYDESDEAQFVVDTIAGLTLQDGVQPGDCAIMYRTNAQSRVLEETFLRANLPYRLVGAQRFYGRREVKDLIAYLRLVHNPADQVSLLRVLNTPPRGLGDKSVSALLQTAERAGIPASRVLLDLAVPDSQFAGTFPGRAGQALTQFGRQLSAWIGSEQELPLGVLVDHILADVRFRDYIDDGTEEGEERWENVQELRRLAEEYAELGMTTFLEYVALVSDQDTLTEAQNAPILLTLHAAKGLEFPVVFIVGLDEGLLPHSRSLGEPEAMAEERRLFYVGITRAKDRLFLVRAFRRRMIGVSEVSEPSRFLEDIPADRVAGDRPGRQTREQAVFERQTRWESLPTAPIQPRYRAGMRIRHPTFGEGMVLETRIAKDDEELTVQFERVGLKWLAASLAKIEILEG